MANLGLSLLLLLICTAVVATADAGAAPESICSVRVSELVECLPAITGKSPPPPSKECCSVMQKANLQCFCGYKSKFAKYGVDPNNAMQLPKKCGRKLPKQCNNKA